MATSARRKETIREQDLLEAARKLFSQKGFASTTVSDIVREAGVAQGTFYLYFESKAAVVQRLLRMFDQLVEEEAAARVDDDQHPAETVRARVRAVFRASAKHVDLLRMLFLDPSIGVAELIRSDRTAREQRMQAAARVLRAGMTSGAIHKMEPNLTARLVFAIIEGAVVEWILHGSDTAPEEFAEGLAQILIHGIVKRSEPVTPEQRSSV